MAKGKRRYGPPPGYISSTEAIQKLGKMLYKHVEDGRVRKLIPEGHQHGFYNRDDVENILASERIFSKTYTPGQWKHRPSSTFERATDADMPAIIAISHAIFGESIIPAEVRLAWLRKNGETFHVLRNQERTIVGYSSLLPLSKQLIDRYIRDEIDGEQITGEDIEEYQPGKPMHIYVMSIGIDPRYSKQEQHQYGARLVSGIFNFFHDLARRGIEVKTITARSHMPDGLSLLRRMGFPQLRSPVQGKNLFAVDVEQSGFPLFVRYSELLAEWKAQHIIQPAPARAREIPSRPRARAEAISGEASIEKTEKQELPQGWVTAGAFAKRHNTREATVTAAIKRGELPAHPGHWKDYRASAKYALDPEQQRACYNFMQGKQNFHPCPDCPH